MKTIVWNMSYFDRRSYLLDNYAELALNENDLVLIMMLDLMNCSCEVIDIKQLSLKLKRDEKAVMDDLGRLIKEKKIELINKNGKIYYSLRPLFEEDELAQIPQSLFDLFSDQFKRPLTATEMDKIGQWMKEYDHEFIVCALREAVIYNKMNFRYINSILIRWKSENKTLEDINGN